MDRYVAFGSDPNGNDLIAFPADSWTVRLVNRGDGRAQLLKGPMVPIYGVVFSPNGQRLVSSGDLFVWDTQTGEKEYGVEDTTGNLMQVVFAPDGSSVLSRTWGGDLVLWDLQTGRERMRLLESHKHTVESMTFSPDGGRIIAATDEEALMVWSAPGYEKRMRPAEFAILQQSRVAWGETRFRFSGPAGRFVITDVQGDVVVSPTTGAIPGWVNVVAPDSTKAQAFSFDVQWSDTSQTARAQGLLVGATSWNVRFYAWEQDKPLTEEENWQQLIQSETLAEETVPRIDYDWDRRAPADHVPSDCFATVATTELQLPAGDYEFRTVSDDGVRLFLDGKKIIDNWSRHVVTLDVAEVSLDDEKHTVRIEQFEALGHAHLHFDIVPAGATVLSDR